MKPTPFSGFTNHVVKRRYSVNYALKKSFKILTLTVVLISVPACRTLRQSTEIGGRIHFENGLTLEFDDVLSLIFTMRDGAESMPKRVTEWTKHYEEAPMSTSIPLAWVKSIVVERYTTQDPYRCLFNPVVLITTVNNVTFRSEYKCLEWIKVKVKDDLGERPERYVYFAADNEINIRKIEFLP